MHASHRGLNCAKCASAPISDMKTFREAIGSVCGCSASCLEVHLPQVN